MKYLKNRFEEQLKRNKPVIISIVSKATIKSSIINRFSHFPMKKYLLFENPIIDVQRKNRVSDGIYANNEIITGRYLLW